MVWPLGRGHHDPCELERFFAPELKLEAHQQLAFAVPAISGDNTEIGLVENVSMVAITAAQR